MPVSGKGGKYPTIITQRYIHFNVDHLISLQVTNTKSAKGLLNYMHQVTTLSGRNQCTCLTEINAFA